MKLSVRYLQIIAQDTLDRLRGRQTDGEIDRQTDVMKARDADKQK